MTHTTDSLSGRGQDLAHNPARVDFELFAEASENRYHPTENPQGAFPLNVAENAVSSHLIQARFEAIMKRGKLPAWTLKYTQSLGHPEVREVMAGFMRKYLGSQAITADNLAFSAGASASLEVCSFLLAEEGDVAAIPAPSYPMYTKDLGIKSGVERYDIQTHTGIEGYESLALVDIPVLEKTQAAIRSAGKRFRMLVLTTPDNPTGAIYSYETLDEIARWCMENEVHLLVNEIYAHSLINTQDPEVADDFQHLPPYRSFTTIMETYKSDYLHLVYALSKDFAISGFRFGILHSLNEAFMTGIANVNIPHLSSNVAQWLVGELFKDEVFIETYIEENQAQLTESYKTVIETLKKMKVPYAPIRGSLFVWADFSAFLTENTPEAEETLWVDIYEQTGLLLTPGTGFGHHKNGLFRIVYSAVPLKDLEVAMQRLESYSNPQNGHA